MGKYDKSLANRLAVPKVYDETAQTPVTHGAQVLRFYGYQGRNVLYDDKRAHTTLPTIKYQAYGLSEQE